MSAPLRIAGFVVAVVAVFAVALVVGRGVGPILEPSSPPSDSGHTGH